MPYDWDFGVSVSLCSGADSLLDRLRTSSASRGRSSKNLVRRVRSWRSRSSRRGPTPNAGRARRVHRDTPVGPDSHRVPKQSGIASGSDCNEREIPQPHRVRKRSKRDGKALWPSDGKKRLVADTGGASTVWRATPRRLMG